MKRSLLITFAVLLAAGPAFAFGGNIGLFQNTLGTNCALMQAAGSTTAHVVHKDHTGTTGSSFSALLPSCAGLTWLADLPQFAITVHNDTLGTQGGSSVGYGTCFTAAVHVLSIQCLKTVNTTGCCVWRVGANLLLAPTAQSVDCAGVPVEEVANGTAVVLRATGQPVSSCPCNIDAEPSTWGVIKELFRQGS